MGKPKKLLITLDDQLELELSALSASLPGKPSKAGMFRDGFQMFKEAQLRNEQVREEFLTRLGRKPLEVVKMDARKAI